MKNHNEEEIEKYLNYLQENGRTDLASLHQIIKRLHPNVRLWFFDGKNPVGKIVSNPNIGYGKTILESSSGVLREYYRIGISQTQKGISIYIMNLKNKNTLTEMFGALTPKVKITSYCIQMKRLSDMPVEALERLINFALTHQKLW
jgi:hypothetical protein